jgi:hypothetical protein
MTEQGILGYFDGPKAIILGARRLQKQNRFKKWDAFVPFPVHTLDEAMDIPRSKLPWMVLCGGLSGLSFAIWFLSWTSAIDYPIWVGGKPMLSWPAWVPIFFELTVLISAFANLGGMLFLCGLPFKANKPLDPGFTDDKFALWIPTTEPGYDEGRYEQLLREAGATQIRVIGKGDA